MIRKIFILAILILMIIGINTYAITPTLEQITNSFNNCSTVKEYASLGSIWTASYNDNKLTVSVLANNTSTNFEYTLEDSILNASFSENDAFTGLVVSTVLIDSIGQLHGYSDGELFTTLNSDQISNYSLKNEGLEIKKIADGSCQIKIDTNKKIPLINISNTYIEVSDLEDLKKFISGDGSAEKSKGNIWFNKSGYDGKNTLLIAEKETLTENTYKSILSIIEVMFDTNKASNYFKSNYSELSIGDKEFSGFKIEINPQKTEWEEMLIKADSGYKFARITIDKNLVSLAINEIDNKENNDENKEINNNSGSINQEKEISDITKDDDVKNLEKLPKTGKSMTIITAILFTIAITIINYIKYYNYNLKKR